MATGKTDSFGRYTNCCFFNSNATKKTKECLALTDFYNSHEPLKQCEGCTFFKTKREFEREAKNSEKRRKRLMQAC